MGAVADLDKSMLESGLLYTEYAMENAPRCEAFEESMDNFEPLEVPSPLMEENFPFLPGSRIPEEKGDERLYARI